MDLHRRYYPETRLPAGLSVSADLTSSEDIAVEGRFEGAITVPDHHVEIGPQRECAQRSWRGR